MRPFDPRLWREAPSARRFLVGAGVLALVEVAATIAQAALLAHAIVGGFLEHRTLASLVPELTAFGGLALLRGAVAWALESAGTITATRVSGELRSRVLAHVAEKRPGAVATAEVATATLDGAAALEPYFARFLPQLLLALLAPPAIIGFVAWEDPLSALILTFTLPLIPIFGILIGKTARARTLARWQALARLSAHFLDVVGGLTTLRAFRRGRAQVETIASVSDAYRRETMGALRIAFLSAFVLELAATLGTAVIAVEIGVRLSAGQLRLEPALATLVLAPELYGALRQLAAQFHASADGLAAAGRLLGLLALPPAVATASRPLPARFGPIRFEAVGKSFPDRGTVLDDISFSVEPGERVALLGPSGAGKTTLLSLLLRLLDPDRGRIGVGDADLGELDARAWRQLVSWLPQRPRLEPGPVADAIGLGRPDADVRGAAVLAGASGLLARRVGEAGAGLSAGEVRRVALARALAAPGRLLLLDEPTAHLDSESAVTIGSCLRGLGRDRTILLATHDHDLLDAVDRVLVLADGSLAQPPGSVV